MRCVPSSLIAALCTVSLSAAAGEFVLASPTIGTEVSLPITHVFEGFGCVGGNRSPALRWANAPAATKSFAVTMFDPDAPTGSGWWHWMVYNLPPSTRELQEDAGGGGALLPVGAMHGRTDFGTYGYGGACPPEGATPHRYVITLHALKVDKLEPPKDASPAMLGYLIHANRLASTSVQTTYGR